MCSSSLGACSCLIPSSRQLPGFHSARTTNVERLLPSLKSSSLCFFTIRNLPSSISCSLDRSRRSSNKQVKSKGHKHPGDEKKVSTKGKGKDNVWSIDNELAKEMEDRQKIKEEKRRRRGPGRRVRKIKDSKVMVSGPLLMEVENVLQTQEPVIRSSWNTFASSVCGIWKGVGAVFSPTTAEMEPIDVGRKNENLYDCYTLSRTELLPMKLGSANSIQRTINWVTLNPFGEVKQTGGSVITKEEHKHNNNNNAPSNIQKPTNGNNSERILPQFESFDFSRSDVMEEDEMGMEPGLVFFEDGSYSRGPVEISVSEVEDSKYYMSPTYKFEQCLVKGCHKRLRIVHTIEFSDGGADIQILRVAVFEEKWVSPANISENSEVELDVKPFSQRRRTHPSELTGSWKVFEMSAIPIYVDDDSLEDSSGTSFVYLGMETLKKRSLPENPMHFGEEDMMDMQDVVILWLPGGVTAYVDVTKDGTLCIGVGWYSDEGINLVMERDYGADGKLKEVRWKSELRRRWTDPNPT